MKIYRNKGITLIALVVTIIILLILAGVSVVSLSDRGLFSRAKEAKQRRNESQALEEIKLIIYQVQMSKNGEATLSDFAEALKDDDTNTYIIRKESLLAKLDSSGITDLSSITDKIYITNLKYNVEILVTSTLEAEISGNVKLNNIILTGSISDMKSIAFGINAKVECIGDNIDYTKCKYVFTTSQNQIGNDENLYTDGYITSNEQLIEKAKAAGNYYLHVLLVDKAGNKKEIISENSVEVASSIDFEYSNHEENIKLIKGTYKLETWGAQGGTWSSTDTAYGGYSVGKINIETPKTLYINVGGQGKRCNTGYDTSSGGYNGGGNAFYDSQSTSGGGGATHIATKSGLLSTLSSSISDILIVSGGGGGSRIDL